MTDKPTFGPKDPWQKYELCIESKEKWSEIITKIAKHFDNEFDHVAVELKGMGRVLQKYFLKKSYQLHAKHVVDILRCSYVFKDIETLYNTLSKIIPYVRVCNSGVTDCVWVKDRFHPNNRIRHGYRDLILMIKIPDHDVCGNSVWGEIQCHIAESFDKKEELHKGYEKSRNHLPGMIPDPGLDPLVVMWKHYSKEGKIALQARDTPASAGTKVPVQSWDEWTRWLKESEQNFFDHKDSTRSRIHKDFLTKLKPVVGEFECLVKESSVHGRPARCLACKGAGAFPPCKADKQCTGDKQCKVCKCKECDGTGMPLISIFKKKVAVLKTIALRRFELFELLELPEIEITCDQNASSLVTRFNDELWRGERLISLFKMNAPEVKVAEVNQVNQVVGKCISGMNTTFLEYLDKFATITWLHPVTPVCPETTSAPPSSSSSSDSDDQDGIPLLIKLGAILMIMMPFCAFYLRQLLKPKKPQFELGWVGC